MGQSEVPRQGRLKRVLVVLGLLSISPILLITYPWWGIDYYKHTMR